MKTKSKITILFLTILILICPISATADANEAQSQTVYLGGEPFGIKMFCDGVLVIGMQDVETENGKEHPAKNSGIKVNDVIINANGEHIESSEELKGIIEASSGDEITLTIKRNDECIETNLLPSVDKSGELKAGLWIKDSTAGLGTITFYSEDKENFCGLGHGICESETNVLLPISSGDVELACITSVTKSSGSDIGTLNGYFTGEDIGDATKNLVNGIYGCTIQDFDSKKSIEIADSSEVKLGEATIITTVNGSTPKEYEAEIIKVFPNDKTKNIVIKITDEELLEITGGIVQGMSGSPIIQNGKLVGAVTHVIVDKVDCGYGIFAENMLKTMEE